MKEYRNRFPESKYCRIVYRVYGVELPVFITFHWALLIYADRTMLPRCLQMSWRHIGTRPSATTILTRLYFHMSESYCGPQRLC